MAMKHSPYFFALIVLAAMILLGAIPAKAETGFLGLQVQGLERKLALALDLQSSGGVLIRDVAMGEAGAKAGFRRGDVIIQFSGKRIRSFDDLIKAVTASKPNQKVAVGILRKKKRQELTLIPGQRPESWKITKGAFCNFSSLGLTVAAMTEKVRKRFSLRWGATGLVVTQADKKKGVSGKISVGDIIAQVNLHDVWNPCQLARHFQQARKARRATVLLLVEQPNGFSYILLRVPGADK